MLFKKKFNLEVSQEDLEYYWMRLIYIILESVSFKSKNQFKIFPIFQVFFVWKKLPLLIGNLNCFMLFGKKAGWWTTHDISMYNICWSPSTYFNFFSLGYKASLMCINLRFILKLSQTKRVFCIIYWFFFVDMKVWSDPFDRKKN